MNSDLRISPGLFPRAASNKVSLIHTETRILAVLAADSISAISDRSTRQYNRATRPEPFGRGGLPIFRPLATLCKTALFRTSRSRFCTNCTSSSAFVPLNSQHSPLNRGHTSQLPTASKFQPPGPEPGDAALSRYLAATPAKPSPLRAPHAPNNSDANRTPPPAAPAWFPVVSVAYEFPRLNPPGNLEPIPQP